MIYKPNAATQGRPETDTPQEHMISERMQLRPGVPYGAGTGYEEAVADQENAESSAAGSRGDAGARNFRGAKASPDTKLLW